MQRTGTKEYKSRHDWEEKVIHLELRKWLKTGHIDKCYMRNQNQSLKLKRIRFSVILKYKWINISARKSDRVQWLKKKYFIDFAFQWTIEWK